MSQLPPPESPNSADENFPVFPNLPSLLNILNSTMKVSAIRPLAWVSVESKDGNGGAEEFQQANAKSQTKDEPRQSRKNDTVK